MQAEHLEKLIATDYKLFAIESASTIRTIREFQPMVRAGKAIYAWQQDSGLHRLEASHINIPKTQTPEMVLNYIQKSKHFGIYLLVDFKQNMFKYETLQALEQISHDSNYNKIIIFINDYCHYPPKLMNQLLITQEPEVKEFTVFSEVA